MIGKAMRLARQYHGKTLTATAFELGVAKSYLSEIEAEKKAPSIEVLQRFALLLDIPLSHLIFFAEQCSSPKKNAIKNLIAGKTLSMLEWIAGDTDEATEKETLSTQSIPHL